MACSVKPVITTTSVAEIEPFCPMLGKKTRRTVACPWTVREPDWIGTAEAARFLGITTRTLYRLIDDGQLKAYRIVACAATTATVHRIIRIQPGGSATCAD